MIVWRIEVMRSADAPQGLLDAIRGLLVDAFDDGFAPEDWEHALGGHHVIAIDGGAVVAHAAVVARHFDVGGRAVSVGYVEAVATDRNRRGQGVGSGVMRAAGDIVRAEYELGALSTGGRTSSTSGSGGRAGRDRRSSAGANGLSARPMKMTASWCSSPTSTST